LNINNTNLLWLIMLSLGLHVFVIAAWQWDSHFDVSPQSSSATLLLAMNAAPTSLTKNNQHKKPATTSTKPVANNKPASKTTQRTSKKPVIKTIKSVTHKNTFSKPHALPEKHEPRSTISAPEAVRQETGKHIALTASTQNPLATVTTSPANAVGKQQDKQQVINDRIQKQLNIRIAFNHHYPSMAIRNAWEGRVNLGIRVLASGELTNVHVIDSSGYNLLDKAAIKSVLRVATLPQARQWLQGRDIDVILPIIYKLTDS
jgi:protein TonB